MPPGSGEPKPVKSAKTYPCPVPGCGRQAAYVAFSAYEVVLRGGATLEDIDATATLSKNASAIEARNLRVTCPVHGERLLQQIGHHRTGSKKANQARKRKSTRQP